MPLGTVHAQLAAPPLASAAAPLVRRGVTVIDVRDGQQLSDQVVVITGTRIQAVGPAAAVRVSVDARVVDAAGKYLMSQRLIGVGAMMWP